MSTPPAPRILVVDDSRSARLFCVVHLQAVGFEVEELDPGSAFDVLAAIDAWKPNLVILDYTMPTCNGESILRLMREDAHFRQVRVLICSGRREAALIQRLVRWRISGYLMKPMTPEALIAAASRALSDPAIAEATPT